MESLHKERYWLTLTLLRLEARSRSHDISMFCIEKCKQPEMLASSKITTPRMQILSDGIDSFIFILIMSHDMLRPPGGLCSLDP